MYIPQKGEIIRVHNWIAVVLDKFTNEAGSVVLYVHTLRNVFRGYAPEYINLDMAPENSIIPATQAELETELKKHQAIREAGLNKLLEAIGKPETIH